VAEAKLTDRKDIEIWGDGLQTRSFTYIDDCLKGTLLLLTGDYVEPLNVGSAELVSINQLVDIVEEIGAVSLERHYDLDAPKGVRGRNSDNTLIQEVFWMATFNASARRTRSDVSMGLRPTGGTTFSLSDHGASPATSRFVECKLSLEYLKYRRIATSHVGMCSTWYRKFIRRNGHILTYDECRHVVGDHGRCGPHGPVLSGEDV